MKKIHLVSTSDHCSVLVIPRHTEKHLAKKEQYRRRQKDLSRENITNMQTILETTEWDVFRESSDDLSELTEVISSYIGFVSDVCIPSTRVTPADLMKRVPADSTIKQLEIEKQKAMSDRDKTLRNRIQRTINKQVRDLRSDTFEQVN